VDLTIDPNRFSYCDLLPRNAVRVAESGVGADQCKDLFAAGFNAILVGTAFLFGPERIEDVLDRFGREVDAFTNAREPMTSFQNPLLEPSPAHT
jgi:hypothetical protein